MIGTVCIEKFEETKGSIRIYISKKTDNTMAKRKRILFDLIFWCFNATFNNISAISWRSVLVLEEAGSTRREPPTMGKQLVNFITCGCESSAPFL